MSENDEEFIDVVYSLEVWLSEPFGKLNVLAIDFLRRDCLSEGAMVPLRVSLHWNNSWTSRLLLSI